MLPLELYKFDLVLHPGPSSKARERRKELAIPGLTGPHTLCIWDALHPLGTPYHCIRRIYVHCQ